MKKSIIYIIIVVLLVFVGFMIFNSNEEKGDVEFGMDVKEPLYTSNYNCEEGKKLVVGFDDGQVIVKLDDGREYTLEQVDSAPWTKFSNDGDEVSFFVKDFGAYMEESGERTHKDCVSE